MAKNRDPKGAVLAPAGGRYASPDGAPAKGENELVVAAAPNNFEYSISNITLTQNGLPVNLTVDPNFDLAISGLASPAGNAPSVRITINYFDGGILKQYAALLFVTANAVTGKWSCTISSGDLRNLSGKDGFLEFTAPGPIGGVDPVTDRVIHVN